MLIMQSKKSSQMSNKLLIFCHIYEFHLQSEKAPKVVESGLRTAFKWSMVAMKLVEVIEVI